MKAKKIIWFGMVNLVALLVIVFLAERIMAVRKYGTRFKPNAYIMEDSITFAAAVEDVYRFYIHHYDEIYRNTAEKHHEFYLLNSDSMRLGTEIYCREGDEREMVYHRYVIKEIIPERLIYKTSQPSTIRKKSANAVTEDHCNAFVYVDFRPLTGNESLVVFTIAIQMPNYFYKLIGRVLGGKRARVEWETHLTEELSGFREQYFKTRHQFTNTQNIDNYEKE